MVADPLTTGRRKCPLKENVCRVESGSYDFEGCHLKKRLGSCRQRELAEGIVKEYKAPISRACEIAQLPRFQYYYRSTNDDSVVIVVLQELAAAHPTYGFRKLFACLRRAGYGWNHKKVYRIYRQLKMNKRRRRKRRLPQRIKQPLLQPDTINKSWRMDQNPKGNCTIFGRSIVNKTRSELGPKQTIEKDELRSRQILAKKIT